MVGAVAGWIPFGSRCPFGDRLLEPQVVESDDSVLIAFGVIEQPGAQDCPDNPSTPIVVELADPLGEREIRDGMVVGSLTSLLPNQ